MSAFFFCLNRKGYAVSEQQVKPMVEAIADFAVDDQQLILKDDFAIVYNALWTTPEEVGSQQPLFDEYSQQWLMFHGRVDNRSELLAQLDLPTNSKTSDAQLLLSFYQAFGQSALTQVIGPMALLLFNQKTKKITAIRDFTGARYLVYYLSDDYLIIANVALAVLAHPDVKFEINSSFLAHKFAFIGPTKADTLIAGVEQVKPGYEINIGDDGCVEERVFYLPDPQKRLYLESDQAYQQEFKRLLTQSVQRCLRTTTSVASMLSGGLDSVPMTIAAAQAVALSDSKSQAIEAFTWVFDRYAGTDEREFTESLFERYAINRNDINCDDAWFDIGDNPNVNALQPFHTPYLAFLYKMNQAIQQKGIKAVLSGIGGDLLYCGDITIIWELLFAGQFRACYHESKQRIKAVGGIKNFIKVYLIKTLPWFRSIRPWLVSAKLVADGGPEWLTGYAKSKIDPNQHWLDEYANQALRPIQYRNLLGCLDANDIAGGRLLDIKYGFEKRYPFRDRDLIEFMLAIPSKQLYFNGQFRPIIKQAFKQELPDNIYRRNTKADFFPVIKRKIMTSKRADDYLSVPHSDWHRYVKKSYINQVDNHDAFHAMLKWHCSYYEAWKEKCYDNVK